MTTLAPGWYRMPGSTRQVFLCAACAVRRGLWPSELLDPPDSERDDCHDCGRQVQAAA